MKENSANLKNIENYKKALDRSFKEMKIKETELRDFIPIYRPEEDEGAFFVRTTLPIPSSVVNDIIKVEDIIYFEYKISVKGKISKNIKSFRNFIEKGEILEFSFYGDVFNLLIFEEIEKTYDTFQNKFNSISSLFEILAQQRFHDYNYRKYWFDKNYEKIIKSISDYEDAVTKYYNISNEIKEKSKSMGLNVKSYYKDLEKSCTIIEAKKELIELKENIDTLERESLNPKYADLTIIKKAIETGNKIKVVSSFKENGVDYFYYYK